MIAIIVSLFVLLLVILTRYYLVKKELKSITKQLESYHTGKTDKKIDITFYEKDIEALALNINRQIDRNKDSEAKRRRTELELKQGVANISHDIRTPLTSIFGYIQLLENENLPANEKKEYVTIIKERTIRLQALLQDFFELSVIDSDDHELTFETIELNQILSETLLEFYDEFNKRGLEPVVQIPEEAVTIIADQSAVKRVLENLIMNAVKHSSGTVTLTLTQLTSSVMFSVSNLTNYLSDNDVEMLFNRFYTTDQTRSGNGTGLGLSIVKGLMNKMDGDIHAEYKNGNLSMICEWKRKK